MLTRQEASVTSERMSPVDAAWLHMDEPGNPADIVSLMTFDEQLPYEGLSKTVEERLLKYARFKQRVVEVDGHPTGELDPKFDLEQHVTERTLDKPLAAETLAEIVAELGNQPLRPDRPSA